jgi:PKD repeat protein
VTFDASASNDQGGPIASYTWSFGDGATGTGVKPSHKYTTVGDKTVTLTVTTPDGRAATAGHTVHVNAPPKAGFDVAPGAPVTGDTVTFTSSATDPDGAADLAAIAWDLNGDGKYNDATGA